MDNRRRITGKKIGVAVSVFLLALVVLSIYFKFYYMLISSVKSDSDILANPFSITMGLHWENYTSAFKKVIQYLGNSFIITGSVVAGVLIVGTMASYVFARFDFPFKNALFLFILAFMMIPDSMTLIPSFVLVTKLKLVNTFWAVILPGITMGQVMYILVIRAFIEGIPKDLFDAGEIEGMTSMGAFLHIVFPLAKPMFISMLLMTFLSSWNEFIWPLLTLSKESLRTVTLGLYSFSDAQQIRYGEMFAGFVLASIVPIVLFMCNMKHFITGITSGAIKA